MTEHDASAPGPWIFALGVPGGIVLGFVTARLLMLVQPFVAGTLGGILFQFVATYATWLMAQSLHLSAILAVVTSAMTLSRQRKFKPAARDRLHSYSMWSTVVFVLNVMAFLLVGLEARGAISGLQRGELWEEIGFALIVLVVVIVVRIVWVAICNVALPPIYRWFGDAERVGPTFKQSAVGAWCGMRGMVTLAAALGLPSDFPSRGLILLTALTVVLGTLIVQGVTLGPLIRWLNFEPDSSHADEIAKTRQALIDASLNHLADRDDAAARLLKQRYRMERAAASNTESPFDIPLQALELDCVRAQRHELTQLRHAGKIDEDVFQLLETQLDLAEVAASPPDRFQLSES